MQVIRQSRRKASDTIVAVVMSVRDYGDICRAIGIVMQMHKSGSDKISASEYDRMRELLMKFGTIDAEV